MSDMPIAYLSIVRGDAGAHTGGLLVTNHQGRPLEFHCTEPVAPNQAQRILYGQTLDGFICGDLIAPTLTKKMKAKPCLMITDSVNCLVARAKGSLSTPMLAVLAAEPVLSRFELLKFQLADQGVAVSASAGEDRVTAERIENATENW
ncbi:MAG: hypothetical protein AAGF97_19785, partial [Planctomycetota bacterium]